MNDDDMKSEMQNKKWSPGYLYILDYGDGKQFKVGITRNNFARYGVKGVFNDYFSFENTNEVQELGL